MKIAFITGIKFTEFDGNYYATTFSRELISERYLSVFEEFTVFADVYPGDYRTPDCQMLSSGNGVKFRFQQSAKRPIGLLLKTHALRGEISDLLFSMDGAIIRLPSTLGLRACEVCRKLDKPYLVEVVGCPWDSLWNHSWKGKLLAPSVFLQTRRCISSAPYVVYTSKKFLPERYPTQGQHTHASNVFLCDYDDSIIKRRLKKISLLNKSITIGSCGQIDLPFKGHKLVVEAMSRMNKQGYDLYYELVGAGNPGYIVNIARRFNVEDRVKIIGRMQQKDVFEWLNTIDIYAQPSLTEGMPRALVEAMSRGVPSLGSDAGAIPELLSPHCLFENKNVRSLMKTLKYLHNHLPETAMEVYTHAKDFAAINIEARRKKIFEDFKEYIISSKR